MGPADRGAVAGGPPHTRGDEPEDIGRANIAPDVRPTRVGMNRQSTRAIARVVRVRPTRVGMNQSCKAPWPISPATTITGAAPHAWGCSSPAMYLSRLTFDLASAAARRDLSDAYETHRTLTRAVSDGPEK